MALLGTAGILLAILGIGFVIFIHELGHFLAAKWAGVRVERFSIGMGPVVWSRTWGDTEYALSLLPIGGYVKMLGQEEMPRAEAQDQQSANPQSFASKSVGWRIVILAAGVVFNLVSSWIIFVALAWIGSPVMPPVIGHIEQQVVDQNGEPQIAPAYRLGLLAGDRILSINGHEVRTFIDVATYIAAHGTDTLSLSIERRGQQLTLDGNGTPVTPIFSRDRGTPSIGAFASRSNRISHIQSLSEELPAMLQPGNAITHINGVDVADQRGGEIENKLMLLTGETISLTVSADNTSQTIELRTISSSSFNRSAFGLPIFVSNVMANSPAAIAQMQAGDVITHIDGQAVRSFDQLNQAVTTAHAAGDTLSLSVLRGDDTIVLELQAHLDQRLNRPLIGITFNLGLTGPYGIPRPDSPLTQAGISAPGIAVDIVPTEERQATDPLTFVVLENPQISYISLSAEQRQTIDTRPAISRLAKLFGSPTPQTLWEKIAGAQIVDATDPSHLRIRRLTAQGPEIHQIPWNQIPDALSPILRGLPPDSVIVNSRFGYQNSQLALALSADPLRTVELVPADVGLAFQFDRNLEIYQAESLAACFAMANEKTWNTLSLTFGLIPKLFQAAEDGGVDATKNLGGPIAIFSALKGSFEQAGFTRLLDFIAVIGLNLFILNLLPIPIVDGGQLLFVIAEGIMRRPVPERVINFANLIGFTLIVMLMIFVFSNDILNQLV